MELLSYFILNGSQAVQARYLICSIFVCRQNLILTCGATHGLHMIITTILHPNGVIFVEEATYMIALDALKQFSGMKIVTGLFTNMVSARPYSTVCLIKKSVVIGISGNKLLRSLHFRWCISMDTSVS
jgi:hypothetical protein